MYIYSHLTLHIPIPIMPSIRAPLFPVMLNIRRTENNVASTSSDPQWQPVIGIVAGFLSILLAVYILHFLFQLHASGVPHALEHALPSGTRRVVTQSGTSGSWPDLSRPAPPPYTARSTIPPAYTVTIPPRSLQGVPVRFSRNYRPPPRRHVDEPISRG